MSENVTREDLLKDCIIALARFDAGDTPEFKHGLLANPGNDEQATYDSVVRDLGYSLESLSLARQVPAVSLQPIPRRVLSFRARARATDPATSHTAAATVDITKDVYQRILKLLEVFTNTLDTYGLTDEDLMFWWRDQYPQYPISASGLRSRRAELVAAGKVVDSGERGQTAAGRSCIIWRLADDA